MKYADLIIFDFDGCLYPGISKVKVALHLTLRIALKPYHPWDRRFLPCLGLTALDLLWMRFCQRMNNRITDGRLVKRYQERLGFIPYHYFEDAAQRLVSDLYPGALNTLGFLCQQVPCGVISLALEPVLLALDHRLQSEFRSCLSFYYGNSLPQATLLESKRAVLSGQDKRDLLRKEIQARGSKKPLVIGNDLEDAAMAVLAREMGGVSIGFNPTDSAKPYFDINLYDRDWYRLNSVLRGFLPVPGKNKPA